MTENIKLTPTQDLLLEVLVARYRLGEHFWTFDSRHKKMLEALASLGFVTVMHGLVENTVRASLTVAGIKAFASNSKYVSPLEKKIINLEDKVKAYETVFGGK